MTARIVVYLRPDQLSWLEEEELRRASGKGRAGARSAIVREALDVKMSAEPIVHAPGCDMGYDCSCGVLEALEPMPDGPDEGDAVNVDWGDK